MSRCGKDYKYYLVELVKAMGQEVIDRAEQIVGDGDLITDLSLWLRFPQDSYPTLEINREHASHNVIEFITGEDGGADMRNAVEIARDIMHEAIDHSVWSDTVNVKEMHRVIDDKYADMRGEQE